ncbi:MAG: CPBP family intramembrane glutamic endopeptidase [Bacillota bacterium]
MQKTLPPSNPPWKVADGIIILIMINVLAFAFKIFGHQWVISAAGRFPGGVSDLNVLLVSSFIQTALFLLFIGYYVFFKYKISFKYLGLVKTRFGHWLKIGFINGIILFFAVVIMGIIINWVSPIEVKPQPIAEIIMSAQTNWEMVIPFIVASIFAPISEELFFRGFLYPSLRSKIGILRGMVVTSLIFGGLHFDLVRMIPLAFGGIWLNWLYEKSGSIYTSIVAHSVWNGIMTMLIFLIPSAMT